MQFLHVIPSYINIDMSDIYFLKSMIWGQSLLWTQL